MGIAFDINFAFYESGGGYCVRIGVGLEAEANFQDGLNACGF